PAEPASRVADGGTPALRSAGAGAWARRAVDALPSPSGGARGAEAGVRPPWAAMGSMARSEFAMGLAGPEQATCRTGAGASAPEPACPSRTARPSVAMVRVDGRVPRERSDAAGAHRAAGGPRPLVPAGRRTLQGGAQ